VSAHWVTRGSQVLTVERPRTIDDFYGFPKALYDVQYLAPGAAVEAKRLAFEQHLLADVGLRNLTPTSKKRSTNAILLRFSAPDRWGTSLLASAHPTLEHYAPILYPMGCTDERDTVSYPYEGIELGSVSMRMALFQPELSLE